MTEKNSYISFFQDLYKRQGQKFKFHAHTIEEFELWKKEGRQELKRIFGLDTLEDIVKEIDPYFGYSQQNIRRAEDWVTEQGYTRCKYELETLPGIFMPFHVLVPDKENLREKYPAVIALPPHGGNKETVAGIPSCKEAAEQMEKNPGQSYGRQFAENGYIVFCPDMSGFGERKEPYSREDLVNMTEVKEDPLGSSCKDLAQTAEALGLSIQALIVWDLMRLLDYIYTCEIVDTERICCAGFSGGGQYSMWLAALDDRITSVVISGYVHSYYDSILDTHLCPCNYAPSLWKWGDISDVCSLIAPRPMYVENGLSDIESGPNGIEAPKEQVKKIREAYSLFNSSDLVMHEIFEGPHMWYGKRVISFLNRATGKTKEN